MSEALTNYHSSLGESRRVSPGGERTHGFCGFSLLESSRWWLLSTPKWQKKNKIKIKKTKKPGQHYRDLSAGQSAPRVKTVTYYMPGLFSVQTIGTRSARQQSESIIPEAATL